MNLKGILFLATFLMTFICHSSKVMFMENNFWRRQFVKYFKEKLKSNLDNLFCTFTLKCSNQSCVYRMLGNASTCPNLGPKSTRLLRNINYAKLPQICIVYRMSFKKKSKSDHQNWITITAQIRYDEMHLKYQQAYSDHCCSRSHISLIRKDKLFILINFVLERINNMFHSQVSSDTKVSYKITKGSTLNTKYATFPKLISPYYLFDNKAEIIEVLSDNESLNFKNESIIFSNRQANFSKMSIKTINMNKNASSDQRSNVSVSSSRVKRNVNASLSTIVQHFVDYSTNWCTENVTQISKLMLNNPSDSLSIKLKKLNLDQFSQKERLSLASFKGHDASIVISQNNADELKRLNCIKSNKNDCNQVCFSFGHIPENAVQLPSTSNEQFVSPLLTMMAIDSSSGGAVATRSLKNPIKVAIPLTDPWKSEDLECAIFNISQFPGAKMLCKIFKVTEYYVFCGCRVFGLVGIIINPIIKPPTTTSSSTEVVMVTTSAPNETLDTTTVFTMPTETTTYSSDNSLTTKITLTTYFPVLYLINSYPQEKEDQAESSAFQSAEAPIKDNFKKIENKTFQGHSGNRNNDDYKEKLSNVNVHNKLAEIPMHSLKLTSSESQIGSDFFYNSPVTVHIILKGSFKAYINDDVTKATLYTIEYLATILGLSPHRFQNLHLSNGSVVIIFKFISTSDISETVESLIALKNIRQINDTRGNVYLVEKILFWNADAKVTPGTSTNIITTAIERTTINTSDTVSDKLESTTEGFINQSNSEVIKFEFIIEEDFKTVQDAGLENYTFNIITQLKHIMHLPDCFFHNFMLREGSIRVSFELWSITGHNITLFTVQRAAENFFTLLSNNRLVIKDPYGKVLKILPVSATISATSKTNQKVNEDDFNYDKTNSFDVVVILSICMGVGFILILAIFLINFLMKLYFRRKYKKQIIPQKSKDIHNSANSSWNQKSDNMSCRNVFSPDKYSYEDLIFGNPNLHNVPAPAVYTPPLNIKDSYVIKNYDKELNKNDLRWMPRRHFKRFL